MAAVFNTSQLGTSVGFIVSGASAVHRISLDVETTNGGVLSDPAGAAWDRAKNGYTALQNVWRTAEKFWLNVAGDVLGSDTLNELSNGIQPAEKTANPASGLGGLLGGRGAALGRDRNRSLTQLISPLGLVTGIGLDFQEAVNKLSGSLVVEAGASQQLYQASISGVVFDSACAGNSAAHAGPHGLEALLEYYHLHRVAQTTNIEPSKTVLMIGKTLLRGYVVGFSADPLNLDYRIWKWSIHLLVNPNYYLNPSPQSQKEPNSLISSKPVSGQE
jgi:hypothetical protein